MPGHHPELRPSIQHHRRKVRGGQHQDHEVLKAPVAQHPHILDLIALLDEAYRLYNFTKESTCLPRGVKSVHFS